MSSIGHISYMIVRAGPVFRIASLYLPTEQEKEKWSSMTDLERLHLLLNGKYFWLGFELLLLTGLSGFFLGMRLGLALTSNTKAEMCTYGVL